MHECMASGGALGRVGINKLCHDYRVWQRLMGAPVSQLTGHMTPSAPVTHLSLVTCRCSARSRPPPPAISPPWSPAPDVWSASLWCLLCLLTLVTVTSLSLLGTTLGWTLINIPSASAVGAHHQPLRPASHWSPAALFSPLIGWLCEAECGVSSVWPLAQPSPAEASQRPEPAPANTKPDQAGARDWLLRALTRHSQWWYVILSTNSRKNLASREKY